MYKREKTDMAESMSKGRERVSGEEVRGEREREEKREREVGWRGHFIGKKMVFSSESNRPYDQFWCISGEILG